ncbi:uncharacterized protein LOC125676326 [Ostrea edulis]|uniref:uncharacterized protein LOC125676326 n=1 Tax=Ostrea edulis TaxID=37623 RepID=UPI002095B56D|nr:uncharacterized protein LOC125676326 [Ostrea edulis]
MINIEVFDLRLSTNNGVCTQSIILDDGNKFINVTCNNNTDFIKFYPFETDTSCLSLTLSNSSHDGYFWFKFTAIGSVSIECPPISCSTITAPTLTTEATTKGSTTTTSRTTTDDQQIYTLTTESTTMTTESTTMTTESTTRESTTRESTTSKTSSTDDQLIYIPLGVVLFLIVLCVVLVLCNKNKCMLWRKSRIYPLTDLGIEYRPRAEIPDAEENMSYYNIYNH